MYIKVIYNIQLAKAYIGLCYTVLTFELVDKILDSFS